MAKLWKAASAGDIARVKKLLARGANVDEVAPRNFTWKLHMHMAVHMDEVLWKMHYVEIIMLWHFFCLLRAELQLTLGPQRMATPFGTCSMQQ
jgi:hypothetical protein